MILHTELNAVPHASLGYHFLRVQVKAKSSSRERRTSRVDGGRSCLQSALAV